MAILPPCTNSSDGETAAPRRVRTADYSDHPNFGAVAASMVKKKAAPRPLAVDEAVIGSNLPSWARPPQVSVNPFVEAVAAANPRLYQAVYAAPIAPPAAPPPEVVKPKLPSLRVFVNGADEFEGSMWSPDLIHQALAEELWRVRDVGETIREGDLLSYANNEDIMVYERVVCWKDTLVTQEQIDLHGYTIWTLEGGGKKRKPLVYRETTEFDGGLMTVPKGVLVVLPNDENEAKRFFGCDVFATEVTEKGRPVKRFCPVPAKMADRSFRQVFSRVFPDAAKKTLRDCIKGLIHGRGMGVHVKRKVSTRKIIDLVEGNVPGTKQQAAPLSPEQVAMQMNLPVETIHHVLANRDYRQTDDRRPAIPFVQRMGARELNPNDFGYDKGLGIEIETVTPIKHEEAQKRVPSYVRCATDGSIRDMDGKKPGELGVHRYGIEFRILIKRSELEDRVVKSIASISGLGAQVNKSCGLHVHFDMRDKTFEQVVPIHERLNKWLSALRELVPPSRRDNQYCAFENPGNAHWAAVSLDAYKRHQTLEVRLHSATLNTTKIIQWVRLLETLRETKFLPPAKISTVDALKMLNLTEADRTYWSKRHQQLNRHLYKDGKLDLSFLGDKAIDEVE